MHIRYLMLDNGIEFQDEVVTADRWGDLKPKTVCKTTDAKIVWPTVKLSEHLNLYVLFTKKL